jgi:hypothetical protein
MMNADKTKIVSYPSPSDLLVNNELLKPIKLNNGYLLDRKGINLNVAFTSYKYADYASRQEAPTISELMNSIINDDPLLELYNCKNYLKIKGNVEKVNALIADGFDGCERIK